MIEKGVIYSCVTFLKESYHYGVYWEAVDIEGKWIKFKTIDHDFIRIIVANEDHIVALRIASESDKIHCKSLLESAKLF